MSKIKMRCTTCGKWFQSANAKEVTCPDCVQKARKEKLAAKTTPPTSKTPGTEIPTRPTAPPPPKPASGGTSHWIDEVSDVKVGQPEQPPRPKLPSSPAPRDTRDTRGEQEPLGNRDRGPGGYRDRDERGPAPGGNRGPGGYRDRDERGSGPGGYRDRGPGGYRDRDERGPGGYREGGNRGPGGYRVGGPGTLDTPGYRPRQPMEGGFGRAPYTPRPGIPGEPRPEGRKGPKVPKEKKPPTPPRPKREKIPPPAPFVPTPEQVAQIEARYQELATPQEFDGIRTQISTELSIPKKAVKKVIQEFRERNQIPSWWEVQTYKGDSEELEKIKTLYLPYLPVPAVGIHKTIAEELELKAGVVYQAIKAIRLEMNLPQFNDPSLHAEELAEKKKQAASKQEAETSETSETSEASETGETAKTSETVADAGSDGTAQTSPATVPEAKEEAPTPVEVAVSPATDGDNTKENTENS